MDRSLVVRGQIEMSHAARRWVKPGTPLDELLALIDGIAIFESRSPLLNGSLTL